MITNRSSAWLAAALGGLVVLWTATPITGVPVPKDVTPPAGVIEGRFVYDGTPPVPKAIDFSAKPQDAPHCKMGSERETTNPKWIVGADGGVANVIVWVRPPAGTAFKLGDTDKVRKELVVIRQPHCAFEPHVFAVFPSYYDAETRTQKSTGQVLKIVNDAPIVHNVNVDFGNRRLNTGENRLLAPWQPGQPPKEIVLDEITPAPPQLGGEDTIKIRCNVHPWMYAHGRVFNHPFFAITRGAAKTDKDFGAFRIVNAPAGIQLDLVYWHESMTAPKSIRKITLAEDGGCKIDDVKIKE
jgi:hypothetical protein